MFIINPNSFKIIVYEQLNVVGIGLCKFLLLTIDTLNIVVD